MADKVKRLTPKAKILREVFLKSGNQCYYPSCTRIMMTDDGEFVGEVCHIEAAMPGRERFNENQTNEDRRQFSNLMLLCHDHHVVTDNEIEYQLERMISIKRDHESVFTNIAGKMKEAFVDQSSLIKESKARSLIKLNESLGWGNTEEELDECVKDIEEFTNRLKKLPIKTRGLLPVIAMRVYRGSTGNLEFSPNEVCEATCSTVKDLQVHLEILENYNFIQHGFETDMGSPAYELNKLNSGWQVWSDLTKFSQKEGVTLELVCKMKLGLLD